MNTQVASIQDKQPAPKSVLLAMSSRYGMEPAAFEQTLRKTVVPDNCTKEQFAAFLLVAREHKLNPITKEIYAFPSKGGIQPIVSIDGWMNLMNSHPQMDGMEFEDIIEDGKIIAIKCKIFRKDRTHPMEVTEYMSECSRGTDPWKKWPARMLRHKSAIQAARYAFGFSGIVEPDEFERGEHAMQDITPEQSPPPPPPMDEIKEVKTPEAETDQGEEFAASQKDDPEIDDADIVEPVSKQDIIDRYATCTDMETLEETLSELTGDIDQLDDEGQAEVQEAFERMEERFAGNEPGGPEESENPAPPEDDAQRQPTSDEYKRHEEMKDKMAKVKTAVLIEDIWGRYKDYFREAHPTVKAMALKTYEEAKAGATKQR